MSKRWAHKKSKLLAACILIYTVLCCATSCNAWGSSKEKVKLQDVGAITLHAGQWTTGRRSSPVPQLMYKGDSSLAHYAPSTVQCHNRGHDGYDVQWECVAELPSEVKFGRINVQCEGYDYPDDPYILRGSCGLEYTLEHTGHRSGGYNSHYNQHHNSYQKNHYKNSEESSFSTLFFLICVGGIIYLVYSNCLAPQTETSNRRETASNQQSPPRRNRLYPDIPPPPYPGTEPSAPESEDPPPAYGWAEDTMPGSGNKGRTSGQYHSTYRDDGQSQTRTQTNTSTNHQSGPGFWSGTVLGGIGGYLFGSRNRHRYYDRPYGGGWNSGWGSGWGRRQPHNYNSGSWFGNSGYGGNSYSSNTGSSWFGSGSSSGSSSNTTRRSTGFGGTSRR